MRVEAQPNPSIERTCHSRLRRLRHAAHVQRWAAFTTTMQCSPTWPDTGTIAAIASIIAAFSVTMLAFRVQREIGMPGRGVGSWIPPADQLLLVTSTLALVAVLLPLVAAHPSSWVHQCLPAPACAALLILLGAYPLALLAHYRLIFSGGRTGVRGPSEPSEVRVIAIAALLATLAFAWSLYLHAA